MNKIFQKFYDLINNLRAELLPLAKVNKVKVGEEYFCISIFDAYEIVSFAMQNDSEICGYISS